VNVTRLPSSIGQTPVALITPADARVLLEPFARCSMPAHALKVRDRWQRPIAIGTMTTAGLRYRACLACARTAPRWYTALEPYPEIELLQRLLRLAEQPTPLSAQTAGRPTW